jgi:hypothetical protein
MAGCLGAQVVRLLEVQTTQRVPSLGEVTCTLQRTPQMVAAGTGSDHDQYPYLAEPTDTRKSNNGIKDVGVNVPEPGYESENLVEWAKTFCFPKHVLCRMA